MGGVAFAHRQSTSSRPTDLSPLSPFGFSLSGGVESACGQHDTQSAAGRRLVLAPSTEWPSWYVLYSSLQEAATGGGRAGWAVRIGWWYDRARPGGVARECSNGAGGPEGYRSHH